MPSPDRRVHRGRRHADHALRALGTELRAARLSGGLSLRTTARAAGISASQLSRLERAKVESVSFRTMAVVFAVLGHRLSVKAYPEGSPLRDEAHARLLERLRRELPDGATLRTEVPLGIPGDPRAWDAEVRLGGARCKVEAETALRDLQATDRRIALKMTDGQVDHVLLLVAATRHNRRALREFQALLRDRYPLGTRAVLKDLRSGRCPRASGIVLL